MHRPHIALIRALPASPLAAYCIAWLGRLVTRALARQLHVPEAVVYSAGLYIHACVDTFERQLIQLLLGKLS
jgi:hypothetical protein